MKKDFSDKLKKLIVIFVFIFIIIIFLILFILYNNFGKKDSQKNNTISNDTEITNTTNTTDAVNTVQNNISNTNTINSNTTNNNTTSDKKTLKKVSGVNTYFFINDILEKYYASNELEDPLLVMNKDVIDSLNLTADNYRQYNDFDGNIFRIDEILEEKIDTNKSIYVVKNRLGKSQNDVKDVIVWVVRDKSSKLFSIYPYEYLKIKGYTDFNEGDTLPINENQNLVENKENKYTENSNLDTETCVKGLFERYKFDLLMDQEHLYNTLNRNYKNLKYSEFQDLKQYIRNNKTDLYLDTISEYKSLEYGNYVQYTAICNSSRQYVFFATDMMNYTMCLDNYTIVPEQEIYEASLPSSQAQYCIERVMQALNYKDFDFVYSKLNPVQKNNYYKDINDFKTFLEKHSYEENKYEIEENYLKISDDLYQFRVKLTDATGKDFSYVMFKMAVTLKDDADFVVSIVSE